MIYLDNNATTRIDPAVREAMLPYLDDCYANPSSPYTPARKAALAIETAREQVARLVGAQPEEIVFTSGGTESNNLAIRHLAAAGAGLAVTAVEHASIREAAQDLERRGTSVQWLAVDAAGQLRSPGDPEKPLCAIWANNETGVILPVSELARGRRVHADAVQAAGKIPLSLGASGVETASLCAHKLHGPKGVGALYVRNGVRVAPLFFGGDQEKGLRPGTENVAAIVGFGAAAELARTNLARMENEIRLLRDGFERAIRAALPDALLAGAESPRLPNTSQWVIPGCETEALLAVLDLAGFCVSSGSACATGAHEPSHVIAAMGLPADRRHAILRVSLGRFSTATELEALAAALPDAVRRLRTRHP